MSKAINLLTRNIRQFRETGLKPGDNVEFGVKGHEILARFTAYQGVFQGEIWQPFSVHDYRSWWDRLVRRPVRISYDGGEFEPFDFFDFMQNQGMEVAIIAGVRVQVRGQTYDLPWKDLRFLRKVS